MKFKIPVYWHVYGEYEVEANSLNEAIQLVEDGTPPYDGLPSEPEYIDDSLRVNMEIVKEINS
jgi:hypothetical protein